MKLYSNIISIFLIWVTCLLLIFFLGFSAILHSGIFNGGFFQSFGNWDGGHYIGVAQHGYSENYKYAFFPLYPMLISFFSFGKNYYLTASLISLVTTFFGLIIFYKLVLLDFDKQTSEKAIEFLLFFATSFFLLTAYTEGLFFFLTVSTFYFARKGNFFLATFFAILAGGTRLIGLAVILGLWIESYKSHSKFRLVTLLAPIGFLGYCWFLYFHTGNFFYFVTAENHWQRSLVFPGSIFISTIQEFSLHGIISTNIQLLLDFLFAVFGILMAVRVIKFLRLSYAVYTIIAVLLPLFTPTLASYPRYLLPIFPIFILLAQVKNKQLIFGYTLFSILLLATYSIFFINGYWAN